MPGKNTKAKTKSSSATIDLPILKEGVKLQGTVLKQVEPGVLVSCSNGMFTGIILGKEVKELQKSGVDLSPGVALEAELISPDMRHEEGYYVISIAKLLQYDIRKSMMEKASKDEVMTVIPTEANLGGLLVDMHGIKGFIPLSQLAPVHYPRVEDGDQEKIFEKLLNLLGQEFKVRVINVDDDGKRIILSEREALREEREKVMKELAVGKEFDGVVSGLSSYGLFVTIGGGIEGLVHISEITYGHVDNIEKLGRVGDKIKVKVIGLEDNKISLSCKQMKIDPWAEIPKKFKVGDIIEGQVIRFVPYGVFVRMYEDINGLIHLSEITEKNVNTPNDAVKIGQVVKAKIILLDPSQRKIGLSIKALNPDYVPPQKKFDKPKKPVTESAEQPKEE